MMTNRSEMIKGKLFKGGETISGKRVTLKYEKDSFSRKGPLLSRKGARGIGSGLIYGHYLLL